jgi:hypothetical protein
MYKRSAIHCHFVGLDRYEGWSNLQWTHSLFCQHNGIQSENLSLNLKSVTTTSRRVDGYLTFCHTTTDIDWPWWFWYQLNLTQKWQWSQWNMYIYLAFSWMRGACCRRILLWVIGRLTSNNDYAPRIWWMTDWEMLTIQQCTTIYSHAYFEWYQKYVKLFAHRKMKKFEFSRVFAANSLRMQPSNSPVCWLMGSIAFKPKKVLEQLGWTTNVLLILILILYSMKYFSICWLSWCWMRAWVGVRVWIIGSYVVTQFWSCVNDGLQRKCLSGLA